MTEQQLFEWCLEQKLLKMAGRLSAPKQKKLESLGRGFKWEFTKGEVEYLLTNTIWTQDIEALEKGGTTELN